MATQRKTSDVLDWLHVSISKWLTNENRTGATAGSPPDFQKAGLQLDCLAGDGSQRTFYRLKIALRETSENYIVLSDPGWHLSKDYSAHQAYLSAQGIPVPRFLYEDAKEGFLVMEDLGDELLQHRIQAEPANRDSWLVGATRLLGELHRRTFPVPAHLPVSQRSFDTQKYSEELAFTAEHLVHLWLGLPALDEAGKNEIKAFSETIAGIGPIVFSHRDYHCRNLLVFGGELFMIDFQDARLGPPHYDLASLVYDAYVPITDSFRNQLIEEYRRTVDGSELAKAIDWSQFQTHLKKVAFQRVVKAAGSFASFSTRWGKDTHLPYLVPALESAIRLQRELGIPEKFFQPSRWLELARKKL